MRRIALLAAVSAVTAVLTFSPALLSGVTSPTGPPVMLAIAAAATASIAPPPCNGHPRNAAGFVVDGAPQCPGPIGPPGNRYQWCVGPEPGHRACMVAIDPGLARPAPYRSSIPRNVIEACIIARESGGSWDPEPPGDGGQRYQFEPGTWVANGGNPATWGHASPAEQDQVFITTVARHGYGPWQNFDGC